MSSRRSSQIISANPVLAPVDRAARDTELFRGLSLVHTGGGIENPAVDIHDDGEGLYVTEPFDTEPIRQTGQLDG